MPVGYSLPRTPRGTSSLVVRPPWHFVGNVLAVEFRADPAKAEVFLPDGLNLESDRCAAYFIEWQYASETGEEYLDPVRSQYRETIILLSAAYEGSPVSFCPFIWVDQDVSMMRGMIQGWPKQIGETWITRAYDLPSKAAPAQGAGGRYGATLSVKGRRLIEAQVTLRESTDVMPVPGFARAVNVRYFPELRLDMQGDPLVHDLVQLKSRDISISPVWKGEAQMEVSEHPYLELHDLSPVEVLSGYRFSFALTVDDIIHLRDL